MARVLAAIVPPFVRIGVVVETHEVNGQPGAIFRDRDNKVLRTLALDILDGRIQMIRSVINPDKFARGPGGGLGGDPRGEPGSHRRGSKPMSDVQAIADRFEIEALRGEFTDAGTARHSGNVNRSADVGALWRFVMSAPILLWPPMIRRRAGQPSRPRPRAATRTRRASSPGPRADRSGVTMHPTNDGNSNIAVNGQRVLAGITDFTSAATLPPV